jgi:hypothetical protein
MLVQAVLLSDANQIILSRSALDLIHHTTAVPESPLGLDIPWSSRASVQTSNCRGKPRRRSMSQGTGYHSTSLRPRYSSPG